MDQPRPRKALASFQHIRNIMMPDRTRPVVQAVLASYEYVAMCLGLGAFALIGLLWMLPAWLGLALLPRAVGKRLGRRAFSWTFRSYLAFLTLFCGCRFDLSALERLRHEPPLILVANHPSLLDALVLMSRFPNAVCVMKATLRHNILLSAPAKLAGYIANDNAREMVLAARDALHHGAHLVIFPEGTRTGNVPLSPFGKSAALIANRAKVPIQCLFIEMSSPYLGKSWPLFSRPSLQLHVKVPIGRRFAPSDDATELNSELERYFQAEILASRACALQSLTPSGTALN